MVHASFLAGLLQRSAQTRNLAYHPGFCGPFGIRFLSGTNMPDTVNLIARHPRWSITWLWFVQWRSGPKRSSAECYCPKWGLRWRKQPYRQPRVLLLGRFGTLSLHTQDAMAYGPGHRGYDRQRHAAYVHRLAKQRAKVAADAAYREMVARMMDGRSDD